MSSVISIENNRLKPQAAVLYRISHRYLSGEVILESLEIRQSSEVKVLEHQNKTNMVLILKSGERESQGIMEDLPCLQVIEK